MPEDGEFFLRGRVGGREAEQNRIWVVVLFPSMGKDASTKHNRDSLSVGRSEGRPSAAVH